MALLGRRVRCHYCNHNSRNESPDSQRKWHCPRCDAVNYFDEHGRITDPPVQATATTTSLSFQFAPTRSTTPVMDRQPTTEVAFCDACQHNQMLLNMSLAEYIPDEDDPEYDYYASTIDAYRLELEERYPQVCEDCLGRVQDRIRAAGYAAKADHLQRMLDKSVKKRSEIQTSRQYWTLMVIGLAKWIYISNLLVGLLWHTFGMTRTQNETMWADDGFSWKTCISQAAFTQQTDTSCSDSNYVIWLAQGALIADLLTIWWNPRLVQKTNHIDGRMRGLKLLWIIRTAVLALRFAGLLYWKQTLIDDDQTLRHFHNYHIVMLLAIILSPVLSWTTVRISYNPFMRPVDENLPSVPRSAEKATRSSPPVRPNMSTFDTMAQSFSSSFPINKVGEPSAALPPSPTLTATSVATTLDTDYTTPHKRRSNDMDLDRMDWTPTQRRFAQNPPPILPSTWRQEAISPPQPQRSPEPVSLFSKPDPNPFRHKIPAAPKNPAQARANPWKPGIWAPPLKATTPNFFKDDARIKEDESKGLDGIGVPKSVKRDAELFQAPKLKYDYYGTPKETGLEGSFNDLFSK